jgi:hypothetical protein
MIENNVLDFAVSNGIGVFFGVLMYFQANTAIKSNTKAINDLTLFLKGKF